MNKETKSLIVDQIESGYLNTLTIEVTEQCNFKCGHCLRGPADKSVFNVNTLHTILSNTPELENIGSLVFTGGEPLLHPEIIDEVLTMLWRFKVDVGSFYIATNGSAFNKESLRVIGRLYEFCQDNDISAIEISNSKWHQEERKRLGLFSRVPSCFEDMYDYFQEDMEYVMENYYPCLQEINFCADRRQYKNMVQEGRYTGPGKKVEHDSENLVYINSRNKIVINACDLSFDSQKQIALAI